jgi:hypothetical protein
MMILLIPAALSALVCTEGKCDTALTADRGTAYSRGDLLRVWAILESWPSDDLSEAPETQYIQWFPTVDKVTVLSIPDPDCNFLSKSNSQITIATPFGNSSAHLYRADSESVIEFLSVLIFFNEGVGTGVRFDSSFDVQACLNPFSQKFNDTCAVTSAIDCEENGTNCEIADATARQECVEKGGEIKIFLGFVGQDLKSVPLVSAQTMPSTFLKFGVGGAVTGAVDLFNDIKDKGKDFFT